MTPIRKPLPGAKPNPARMAERFKNRVTSMITGGPKTVPRQTLVGTQPKPAGYGDVPQVRPVSGPPSNMADPMRKISGLSANMKKGGSVSSASSRADGCATKGKTKGKII